MRLSDLTLRSVKRTENAISREEKENSRELLHLLPGLGQRYCHIHLLLIAEDRDLDRVAGTMIVHHLRQVLLVRDFFAIDGYDQVSSQRYRNVAQIGALRACAQSGAVRRAVRSDLQDQQTIVRGQ